MRMNSIVWRSRALWRAALLVLACVLGAPLAVQAAGVLIITTSPAQPGRFVALEQAAKSMGFSLQARFVEKIPADEFQPALWRGADLVLLDAPRAHIEDFMRGKLGAALPALDRVPHVWLPTSAPKPGDGLDADFAARVHGYFVQGGARNTDWLLQALAAYEAGRDWRSLPAPQVFPTAGLYHPQLAQTVVGTPAEYFAARGIDPAHRPPTIAIAFHQQSIASGQTGFIDDMIRRIEAQGAIALPFYSPVLDADAVRRMVMLDGKPVADVIINTQITLYPEGRRTEFEALGLPVIQAMAWRRGDAAQWQADPQGVPLNDVPFYLAQAEYTGIADIQVAMATRAGDEQLVAIEAQAAAVANKALNLVKLQRKPAADKRVAIFFWNYPAGEKNLSASFMNLPRSLSATLGALQAKGYRILNWGTGGWVQMFSKKPLKNLDDVKAAKLFTSKGDDRTVQFYASNGFHPVALLPSDIPAQLKLSTGLIDTAPYPPYMALTLQIFRVLKARRLTQAQAGKLLGIPQPHVSDLLNGRARAFSAERLMAFLAALGHDVEVRVKRTRKAHGHVSVVVAA